MAKLGILGFGGIFWISSCLHMGWNVRTITMDCLCVGKTSSTNYVFKRKIISFSCVPFPLLKLHEYMQGASMKIFI